MEESVSAQFSKKARNVLLAKIILVVIAGTLCGYYIAKDSTPSHNPNPGTGQIQKILEKIETKQTDKPVKSIDPLTLVVLIIMMNIIFFLFFGVYELLGHGLGVLITGISKKT